jgi:hypothetical protein
VVGDFATEQGVRTAVDPDDQDGSAVLDLEMALVFAGQGLSFRIRWALTSYMTVIIIMLII